MKQSSRLLGLLAAMVVISLPAPAQRPADTLDENLFVKQFAYLFRYRGFRDSIVTRKGSTLLARVKFPGAVMKVEPHGNRERFAIRYPCSDSNNGRLLIDRLRGLIEKSIATIGWNVKYKGAGLYFHNLRELTTEYHSLTLDPPEPTNQGTTPGSNREVVLRVELAADTYTFLNKGSLRDVQNKAMTELLRQALGSDTLMQGLKKRPGSARDPRTGEFYYESLKTVPGFKAVIAEIRQTETTGGRTRVFSTNRLELTAEFRGSDSAFLKNTDSLVARLRGSLPGDFCYQIDSRGQRVYFRKLPWLPTEDVTWSVLLQYMSAGTALPGIYWQRIIVFRPTTENRTGLY